MKLMKRVYEMKSYSDGGMMYGGKSGGGVVLNCWY